MRIDPENVRRVAQVIGSHDFRVTIQSYVTGKQRPWIITVGETNWQRHLVVEKIDEENCDAELLVLARTQSGHFGYDIDTKDVERRTTLYELIARGYSGVKDGLGLGLVT